MVSGILLFDREQSLSSYNRFVFFTWSKSGFKTLGFKTSGLQNVTFTKRQVLKRLVSKRMAQLKISLRLKQQLIQYFGKYLFDYRHGTGTYVWKDKNEKYDT